MFRTSATALALSFLCLSPQTVFASPESAIQAQAPQALQTIYQQRQFVPLWLEDGRPTDRAREAITAIKTAADDALLPDNYAISSLEQQLGALENDAGNDQQQAAFDLMLSRALADFMHDLAIGRVDPRTLGFNIDTTARRDALPDRIAQVLTAPDVSTALQAVRPTFSRYLGLRNLLPAYRTLAMQYPDSPALPALPMKKNKVVALKPGTAWAGTAALAKWLVVLGDIPAGLASTDETILPDGNIEGAVYGGDVVEGVKHFQTRHGMTADGVVGTQTLQALRTPLPTRVRQIELSMERLRWIDSAVENRSYILVNIPQFTLWAHLPADATPDAGLHMAIIAGKVKSPTPSMTKTLSTTVFSPYWNVPRSIALKELVPKLRKEPGYLTGEEMEMVGVDGSIYRGDVGETQIAWLQHGSHRIRQRPGEHNALGGVKFVFPNDDNVYMHDTPQKNLFAKDRRDFSHGCIRLAEPAALALFALRANGDWDAARIQAQMFAGQEQHISLKEKIPVLVLYFTANVNSDGHAVFAQDIYQQDAALEAALATRSH